MDPNGLPFVLQPIVKLYRKAVAFRVFLMKSCFVMFQDTHSRVQISGKETNAFETKNTKQDVHLQIRPTLPTEMNDYVDMAFGRKGMGMATLECLHHCTPPPF